MSNLTPSADFAFKPTTDGWVFVPSAAILGPWFASRFGVHYLVDDSRKAAITASLEELRRAIRKVCRFYALICGLIVFALFAFLAAYLALPSLRLPRLPEIGIGVTSLMLLILLSPLAAVLGRYMFSMRQLLARAPRTSLRISHDEYLAREAAALSLKRIRLQLFACLLLVACVLAQLGESLATRGLSSWIFWSALLVPLGASAMHCFKVLRAKRDMPRDMPLATNI
jgi:TRAP-type C4-dicarboxylate transport system permease small subunit